MMMKLVLPNSFIIHVRQVRQNRNERCVLNYFEGFSKKVSEKILIDTVEETRLAFESLVPTVCDSVQVKFDKERHGIDLRIVTKDPKMIHSVLAAEFMTNSAVGAMTLAEIFMLAGIQLSQKSALPNSIKSVKKIEVQ